MALPNCPIDSTRNPASFALTQVIDDNISSFLDFQFVQMFLAPAPENICHLISHEDQTRPMVDKAYNVFYTETRVKIDRKLYAIAITGTTRNESGRIYEIDLQINCKTFKHHI